MEILTKAIKSMFAGLAMLATGSTAQADEANTNSDIATCVIAIQPSDVRPSDILDSALLADIFCPRVEDPNTAMPDLIAEKIDSLNNEQGWLERDIQLIEKTLPYVDNKGTSPYDPVAFAKLSDKLAESQARLTTVTSTNSYVIVSFNMAALENAYDVHGARVYTPQVEGNAIRGADGTFAFVADPSPAVIGPRVK